MNKLIINITTIAIMFSWGIVAFAQTEVLDSKKPIPSRTIEILKPLSGIEAKPGDTISVVLKKTGKDVASLLDATVSGPEYGAQNMVIATGVKGNAFTWKVPTNLDDGTYLIVVRSPKTQSFAKLTVRVFQKKVITVLSPNGGEKYKVGDMVKITWKTNLSTSTPIFLQLEDTRSPNRFSPILASGVSVPNTGSYEWEIPESLSEDVKLGTVGAVYRIMVAGGIDTTVSDWSNAKFSITKNLTKGVYRLSGRPTIQIDGLNQVGSTTSASARFQFTVNAVGGTVFPKTSDFTVKFFKGIPISSSSVPIVAPAVLATVIPNQPILEGNSANVTVTAQVTAKDLIGSGMYYAQIQTPDGQIINTDWGVNVVTKSSSYAASVIEAIRTIFGF